MIHSSRESALESSLCGTLDAEVSYVLPRAVHPPVNPLGFWECRRCREHSKGYDNMFTTFPLYQLESWFESNNELDQSRAELFSCVLRIHDPIRMKMWFRNKQLLEDLKKTAEDSRVLKSNKSGLENERDAPRQEKRQGKRKVREVPKPDDRGLERDIDQGQLPPLEFEEGDRPWWQDIY